MASPIWKLYYWPLAGRGEFIRLIFEAAQVPFEEENDKDELAKIGFISGAAEFKQVENPGMWPCFAVPMVERKDTGFRVSQAPVICKYLGEQFGLSPENQEDAIHGEQVVATVFDYITEGRLSFHGKNFYESFFNQQEETKPYIAYFIQNRIPRFFAHFDKILAHNKSDSGFVLGEKLTYVDLALLHVLRATQAQFPEVWSDETGKFPRLAAFKAKIEGTEPLSAYLKSSRHALVAYHGHEDILYFLEKGEYPKERWFKLGVEKAKLDNLKRMLRRKVKKFKVLKGVLHYCSKKGERRVILTAEERKKILKSAHDARGHMGYHKVLNYISQSYYWEQMVKDCVAYVQSCHECQMVDPQGFDKEKVTLHCIPVTCVWNHVEVDLITMPMSMQGNNYLLTLNLCCAHSEQSSCYSIQ